MGNSSNYDKACDGESVGTILNQMTNLRASDPETDISSITSCHIMPEESLQDVDLEGNCGDIEEENQFVCVENSDDGFSWEMDNRSYEELLNKFIEKEEELRVSNFKLQLSEQEILRLKVQVENRESQINDMHDKLELKEDELYEQKELSCQKIYKLVTQIKKSESQLDNVRGELNLKNGQLDNVHKELNVNKDQLLMMHKKLNLKNVELDNVRGELNLKSVELDNVRGELNLKSVELDNVRGELNLKNVELDNVCGELNLKSVELDNVRGELNLKNVELDNVCGELNLKSVELDNVRGELNLKNVELDNVRKELELKAGEFDNVCKELKLKEKELNEQKELGSKASMTHELQCQVKEEKENIVALKCKLERLVRTNIEDNDINHKEELRRLISTLFDLHVKSFWKKEEMRSDIASLSKLKEQLTSKLEQAYMKLKN